jgi:hypothetical protein
LYKKDIFSIFKKNISWYEEEFEDTKGAIRIRISKNTSGGWGVGVGPSTG